MVRHSESAKNIRPDLIGGRSNEAELTPKGELQSDMLGYWMVRESVKPTAAYASTAVRTNATLKRAFEVAGLSLPIQQREDLLEMSQGVAEGLPRIDVYTPEVLAQIERDLLDFKLEEGESMNEVADRTIAALLDIAAQHQDEIVIVGGHGLGKRCVFGRILGWSHEEIRANDVPNTAVSRLRIEEDQIEVVSFAEQVIQDPEVIAWAAAR